MLEKITQMVGEDRELTPAQENRIAYSQSPEGLAKLAAENKKTANIKALTQQILGQKTTDKWTGQGWGSAEKNAEAMAKMLDAAGMTDIRQFGKVDKYEPVTEIGKSYNGKRVYQTGADEYGNNEGSYYYREPTEETDSEGNVVYRTVMVPKDAKLDSLYGVPDIGGEGYNPVDSSKVVMRDGVPSTVTGKTFGNKETGQTIESGSGRWQWQGGDNLFGGTGEGKGNTGYRVQFSDDGTPIFYTTQGSSNDFAKLMSDIGPIGNIAVAAIGGPMAVAALQAASGKPIGDIVKSAALSYLGGQAGEFVSGTPGITDALGKAGTDALSGAAKQFVASGGKADPLQLLAGAGLSYGANTLGSEFGLDKLTPAQQKMLNTALSGAAAGMPLDKLLMNVAMTGATSKGGLFSSDPMTVNPNPDNLEDFLASIDQYKVDQNADASGPGYYDEITGKFISDELGGLQNPLGADTGNIDPNKQWEYNLVRPGVWADADGNEIDLTYLPNSETALSGEEIMRRAGALPGGGATNIKVPTPKGSKPSTTSPDSSLAAMIAAMNGQQQTIQVPSQDPFAHIKLMQDLFGTSVDLTPTDSSDNSSSFGQKSSREDGQDEETTGEDAE